MTSSLATIANPTTDLTPARQIGLTPQSIDEAMRMAELMSKASIVPKDFQGNPGNILVAIQWGAELGLPPLQAMQSIAVINGRPTIWGDAVIALVRGSGLLEAIQEDVGDTSATCTVKRRGETPTARTFSLEDAKKAGLSGKQGPWTQYPKRMMQMRARAWALRDVFPDVLRGVHVAEEAQDMPPERAMGPAPILAEPAPGASRTSDVKARLAAKRKLAEPAPDLDDVLSGIASAETLTELKATAPLAAKLTDPESKTTARAAYADRKAALEQPTTDPQASAQTDEVPKPDGAAWILAGITAAETTDLVADWEEEARLADLTPEERAAIDQAAESRRAELAGG